MAIRNRKVVFIEYDDGSIHLFNAPAAPASLKRWSAAHNQRFTQAEKGRASGRARRNTPTRRAFEQAYDRFVSLNGRHPKQHHQVASLMPARHREAFLVLDRSTRSAWFKGKKPSEK